MRGTGQPWRHRSRADGRLRTGVVGFGYFGRYHAEKIAGLARSEFVAVADVEPARAEEAAQTFGVKGFADYRDLVPLVDAVSIVVPTLAHHRVAKTFLENGIHVLLEKPMTDDLDAATELIDLAKRRDLVLQVGHLVRFSGVATALAKKVSRPAFIESVRIFPFRTRGTDVNVILDLMIHDIDLILWLVKAPVASIDAAGAPVFSSSEDIANARVKFQNGCIANLTASRISLKTERTMRIFQPGAYISVEFDNHKIRVVRKGAEGPPGDLPEVTVEEDVYDEGDDLEREIDAFLGAIIDKRPPLVSGVDGRRAVEAAIMINRSLRKNWEVLQGASNDAAGGGEPD